VLRFRTGLFPVLFLSCFAAGLEQTLPTPFPAADRKVAYAVEQVRVRTSDGVALDGILYRPAAKPRPIAFLLVHGFGSNFYSEYFPQFALAAAEQGYSCLALNMRDHGNGPKVSDFTDNEADIASGVAYLGKLGHPRAALLGQSIGVNRVLYYQAATRDPNIVATVLVSGPGNLFEWNAWQFGREKAKAVVEEALALEASGHERQLMLVDLGPLGKALYTPRYLLSLRGPKAQSDPYRNAEKVTNPILIVQGTADSLVEPGVAERLRRAAASSRKVEVIHLEGADHIFSKQESALAQRILAWVGEVAH
jgi:pimeloyl-ACP methyl ester carboxylesterase